MQHPQIAPQENSVPQFESLVDTTDKDKFRAVINEFLQRRRVVVLLLHVEDGPLVGFRERVIRRVLDFQIQRCRGYRQTALTYGCNTPTNARRASSIFPVEYFP
jgi:hypothetical protein